MTNEIIDIEWKERLNSFLKLLERENEESQFNLEQIQECAHKLHRDYPRQVEIPFFMLRLYRIIGRYKAAWEIVKEIEGNQGYWKGPSDMSGSELLFEKSLLAYFHNKDSAQALRFSVEYLNIDDSYNWEYIYENLASLCRPLARHPNIKLYKMALPCLGSYHASSISHVRYQGEDCLCARYVNYNIDPSSGVYDCDEFNSTNMAILGNKMEIIINKIDIPIQSTKYHGIEDCRLYLDSLGTMRFIGTQQEYVAGGAGINRMIDGRLDMESFVFCDAKVLYPPDETSLCEKNWIPWLSPGGVVNYIYWWHPFQIGRLNNKNRLEIVSEQTVPAFFKGFRGSSCLVPWKNMLCAVVHFVHTPMKGVGTRRYYHCLVFFEVRDDLPFIVKYTLPFTFLVSLETLDRGAIEYCLGFDICGGEGGEGGGDGGEGGGDGAIARFWFSCLDADPHRLEIPMEYFESIIV